MNAYLNLLQEVLDHGLIREDRTGVGTRGVFGRQIRFDLSDGFPLVTTKKIHLKSVIVELLWFLRGDTNVKWLQERGVRIWNEWADEDGQPWPGLRQQWRAFQSKRGHRRSNRQLVANLRRLRTPGVVVCAWNPVRWKTWPSTMPRLVPIPCADGRLSPAVPAVGRFVLGRAFQYCVLCPPDHDAGPSHRAQSRRLSCTPLATLTCTKTTSNRQRTTLPIAPTAAHHAPQPQNHPP